MGVILKIENISKQYRLGLVGTGSLSHDLNRVWARMRGKEDPYAAVGALNDRTSKANEDYVWALREINIEVQEGEVLGIIGKNGAGKSTLLKILSRVTGPTTGVIKSNGRIASLLEVGTGFHPELTGRENIFLNGAILGMTKAEIKTKEEEIIDFSGCQMYIDTPVKRYSSGMRVRLAFAVAAHLEPDILVIDEVLAVGDAEFQKKAIGKMQDISKGDGRTVLFVSHNMASVQKLCTEVLVLENGTSVFRGNTSEGIKKYLAKNRKQISDDVKTRNDRNGGDIFRFTNFIATDSKGVELAIITTGMDVRLVFEYEAKKSLSNVVIRIKILNSKGETISILNNFHCGLPFDNIEPNGSIICEIPKIPLVKGEYFLDVKCLVNMDIVDDLENIGILNIENGDFFGTGKIPNLNNGVLLNQNYYVL
jgi:lipopolysaccharide transport system ATP-binding protein